jgi:ribosomal protein S18 acetylase RimI-like enzyme
MRPLEEQGFARFSELFAEFMPPDADSVYAELGLTPEEATRLPLEVELRQVELGVLPDNEQALGLYEKAGFERVGERLGFLIMRKRLPRGAGD